MGCLILKNMAAKQDGFQVIVVLKLSVQGCILNCMLGSTVFSRSVLRGKKEMMRDRL